MHDLRNDPDAHAIDERTRYDLPTVTVPAHVLTPAQLRTVPAPNLREPSYDTRTEQEKLTAELVRLVDVLQAHELRLSLLEERQPAVETLGYIAQVDYWTAVQHLAVQRLGALDAEVAA